MSQQKPIIVILGSTATGKTKLSIELARRFNGEIISADSMQVYKGLDISTAKATAEERSQAAHHMLDVCDLETKTFTVADYRNQALPVIERIIADGKVPIIVGGTTYYIESLLWKVLIDDKNVECIRPGSSEPSRNQVRQIIDKSNKILVDSKELHGVLEQIDPFTASQIHPNNKRKVLRALEIYANTGLTKSVLLDEQQTESGGNPLGGPLRFKHILCFWLKCDQGKLDTRIDRRIETMIGQGMLFELRACYNQLKMNEMDPTKGILQAIGFKEFLPYLQKYEEEVVDAEITEFIRTNQGIVTTTHVLDALKLLEQCLDELRLNTKRYSKKQLKWIQNRLILFNERIMPPIYELDGSHAEISWEADVFNKAENIIQSYIDDVEPNFRPIERNAMNGRRNVHTSNYCADCDRRFIGDAEFSAHMQSQRHKKVRKSRRMRNERNQIVAIQPHRQIFQRISGVVRTFRQWVLSYFQRN